MAGSYQFPGSGPPGEGSGVHRPHGSQNGWHSLHSHHRQRGDRLLCHLPQFDGTSAGCRQYRSPRPAGGNRDLGQWGVSRSAGVVAVREGLGSVGGQQEPALPTPPQIPLGPAAILTIATPRSLWVLVVLHRILRVLILIIFGGHPACTQGGPGLCCPAPAHGAGQAALVFRVCAQECPCVRPACMSALACLCPTRPCPVGPAVLTFLLCMRDPEHRHEVALGASSICCITRDGSWSKEQGGTGPWGHHDGHPSPAPTEGTR